MPPQRATRSEAKPVAALADLDIRVEIVSKINEMKVNRILSCKEEAGWTSLELRIFKENYRANKHILHFPTERKTIPTTSTTI